MDGASQSNSKHIDPGSATTRSAAEVYARNGWSVIPIPHQSKNPGFKGWEQMRLSVETLDQHFNGHPQNIGVLLGEPSGWLIDVDLDHVRAIELATQFLPETPAIFGRTGKPRSHWIYRVDAEAKVKKSGTIVKSPDKGFPMKSPYLSIAEAAMQQMIRLSVEFGLTPSSRSRIRLQHGARKSKLDKFLDKKQRA